MNAPAPGPAPAPLPRQVWLRSALILLVPAVLLVTSLAIRHVRSRAAADAPAQVSSLQTNWQSALDLSEAAASAAPRRAVFPYSVIPGGVRDAKELQAAASKDPVVAQHYSDFRIVRAHTLRLDRPALMYVSYRLSNRVYWTRKPVHIPAGETLISDGENYARVRCGNRLSPIAALPVSLSEPPTEKLETPDFIPPLLADLMPGEGFGSFPLPNTLSGPPTLPGTPVASGVPPVGFPPILPPGVVPPGGSTVTPPPGNPPPTATSEPGVFTLLLSAVFAFALLWLVRRK